MALDRLDNAVLSSNPATIPIDWKTPHTMKETITILYPAVSHVTKGFSLLILLGLSQGFNPTALSQGSNPTPENRNGYTIFMLFVDCKKTTTDQTHGKKNTQMNIMGWGHHI